MKRFLMAIGLILTAGFLLVSESPSLDGRALVADEGLFPKGLFAKTVGYLPGDSISVTNPSSGERIDILVIGSLDPSAGVAVLLSPEAADALNIKKNSNNLVKLTKRNGNADEIANGSAVISSGSALEAAEEKPLTEVIEEAIESGEPVDQAVAQAVEEAEEEVADKAFDNAEDEIAVAEAEGSEEDAVEEVSQEVAEGEDESLEDEELAALEGEDEGNVDEEVEIAEGDAVQEEAEIVYPEYEAVEDELAGEIEPEEEEFVEAEVADEIPEETLPESEVVEAEELEDEYDAIVLVPSDAKAPESFASESVSPSEAEILEEAQPSKVSGVSYLNGYSDLAAEKYYVQIAVYKSAQNVEEIASKYGDRYPIAVIQSEGKNPVLVGPLNVDEYGVVLERFKSYGFKDAFVKFGR